MKDRLTNQIDSYRARLACLDKPEHRAIWLDQAPVKFTEKVAEARALFAELAEMAGEQNADLSGIAKEKARARELLIEEAHALGQIVTVYARDHRNETLAAPYHLAISEWQGMRHLAVLQRARLLEKDVARLVTEAGAVAEEYALTAETLAVLTAAADRFEALNIEPRAALAHRAQLTAALPGKSRAVKAKFAEVEALLPPFGKTPAGESFIAAYLISRQIIDRGRGWREREEGGGE